MASAPQDYKEGRPKVNQNRELGVSPHKDHPTALGIKPIQPSRFQWASGVSAGFFTGSRNRYPHIGRIYGYGTLDLLGAGFSGWTHSESNALRTAGTVLKDLPFNELIGGES